MADAYFKRLSFSVSGLPSDTFAVFRSSGREAISELFRFEVGIASDSSDLPLAGLAGKDATLTINHLGQTRRVYGMLECLELNRSMP